LGADAGSAGSEAGKAAGTGTGGSGDEQQSKQEQQQEQQEEEKHIAGTLGQQPAELGTDAVVPAQEEAVAGAPKQRKELSIAAR
jgi:hypothetical protein